MAQIVSLPIFLGQPAAEGPRYITQNLTYPSVASTSGLIDATNSGMSSIQSIFIDNSLNGVPFIMTVQDSGQIINVPAYCSQISPVYTGNLRFSYVITAAANASPANVVIKLFNFPQNFSTSVPAGAAAFQLLASNVGWSVSNGATGTIATIVASGNYSITNYDVWITAWSGTNPATGELNLKCGSTSLAPFFGTIPSGGFTVPIEIANVTYDQPLVLPRGNAIILNCITSFVTVPPTTVSGFVDIYGYSLA